MVKYYGRAKTITGSINTNQSGLNMSGTASSVGHSYSIQRYINRRVDSLVGVCGMPTQNGGSWRQSLKNKPPYCRPGANKCLAAAGGVGRTNIPYYKTPKSGEKGCGVERTRIPFKITEAVRTLQHYFKKTFKGEGSLILVGPRETLKNDLDASGVNYTPFENIKHYEKNNTEYTEYKQLPPNIKLAVDIINNLEISLQITPGDPFVKHIVGYESAGGQLASHNAGFGVTIKLGPNNITNGDGVLVGDWVIAYAVNPDAPKPETDYETDDENSWFDFEEGEHY